MAGTVAAAGLTCGRWRERTPPGRQIRPDLASLMRSYAWAVMTALSSDRVRGWPLELRLAAVHGGAVDLLQRPLHRGLPRRRSAAAFGEKDLQGGDLGVRQQAAQAVQLAHGVIPRVRRAMASHAREASGVQIPRASAARVARISVAAAASRR